MKKQIMPVLHYVSDQQVQENVETCLASEIKSVFLINHNSDYRSLISCGEWIKSKYDISLGVNFLDLKTNEALAMENELFSMLWCDKCLPAEETIKSRKFKGLYFGGLAFKYQPQPKDLKAHCLEVKMCVDVPTTSGSGTGKAANMEKIKRIKEYLGDSPLALASGVSADNIQSYCEYVDYFLVASSITNGNELIIPEKLKELKLQIK